MDKPHRWTRAVKRALEGQMATLHPDGTCVPLRNDSRKLVRTPRLKKSGCPYPKNCGWVESASGCTNLLCPRMSAAALKTIPFFAGGNPFATKRRRS